ncbi:BTAD domain-containing putative transcriptional regulator [Streptomyces sp. WMMC500]|uniref:AfsR/SARP family transcriptional regulator n=1 Tax=Streptomyces sp. WMMC500 TaxID=3015154 RepID=UPI00248B2BE8|nr:BTAD domain-containing putative transcriptional regulator [Streptomyces sp. WMMC500]WBB62489.1 BTAD domain-containing putative transcriptional regulator [Streptomyces sp. WMMC500]
MGEPTFGLLGPLRVWAGGVPVRIGGPKPRAALATLLLQPGRFVSVDVLTEVLWPGGAPPSAVANVRTYVRNLRRALASAGISAAGLRTEPSGYAFDVAPDDVDMLLFERRLDRARAARDRGDDVAALHGYEAALGLWRGGVLQDVPASVVWDPGVTRLEELRATAVDECLGVRLRLRDYALLLAELRARLTEDPLREDLWRMLVRALHDSGRTTEARSAYAEAERILAAELGTEPSRPLRAVGEEVNGYAARRRAAAVTPVCQLPMDVPDFTGRTAEIAALEKLLAAADRRPVVVAMSGPPGSGKSALTVHVAHRARAAFPDGQLFVDLGGLSDRPRDPADVLAEMLRGLGVVDSTVPAERSERAALLRSRLAQRRFLIVLDDAADGAQVRPLLPGTGGSAVLVSSRHRMPDLPAHHFSLGELTRDEARALLAAVAGPGRPDTDAAGADRVLAGCGSLPLAVRIAGSRLANRRSWTAATLADLLQDERGRLDQLQAGELEVRASAELSYRHLPEAAATAFRAFGRLPAEPVGGWLVAVAMGCASDGASDGVSAGGAAEALATLADRHLIEAVGTDALGLPRYRMHDLLRCYARELADADTFTVRRRQQLRIVDALTALARTANAAMPTRFLGVFGAAAHPAGPDGPDGPDAEITRAVRARPVAWFETERRILVATVESALRLGRVAQAADLALELASFFDLRGYYGDWLRTHQLVLDAIPAPADARAAALLRNIGQLHLYRDRYADALDSFAWARALFGAVGHPSGEAVAAAGEGSVHRILGDLDAALATFTDALGGFRQAGDRHGEAVARNAIASVWLERKDPRAAASWLDGALELARDLGDRHREAQVRRRVAVLHDLRGDADLARAELERALDIFGDLADTHCAAYVQESIGELCLRRGNAGEASALLADALAVQRQLGDRRAEASLACLLGELHRATGRVQTARHYFHRSLSTWRRLEAHDRAASVHAKLRALHSGPG